ncbi:hypothetical protein [Kordia jejudonensis]|uniref:hypothetical protein n=1 Tax=Kordia jejudonensis TaxID=1348245 RepID=UPI0006290436|nr:hypothetical protein [Kordia jejudonensis]
MNHVTKYLKLIIVINIIFFFTSCSILKSQEQKTLDDIKQIAKLNFEMQFRSNKRAKVKKNEAYIYLTISQNERFIHFLLNEERMRSIIKDTTVLNQLFNNKEIEHYKKQLTNANDIEVVINFVDCDSIRKKPQIVRGVEVLSSSVFTMMFPVFSRDGNYAIFTSGMEGNFYGITIYKKYDNEWKGEYYFLAGIS